MTEPEVIGRLRARSAQEPPVPTIAQLRRLRDTLQDPGATLEKTSRLLGLSSEQILEIVASFGKWVMQTAPEKMRLPQPLPPDEYLESIRARQVNAKTYDSELVQLKMLNLPSRTERLRNNRTVPRTMIPAPAGFLETGGKQLRRPLSALLVSDISDEQLDRWAARTYTASLPLLTFPVVAGVWRMATMRRLDELDEVSPSPRFAKVAVDAWELLEGARTGAICAVGELTGPMLERAESETITDEQLERVVRLARSASWLCEHDLGRVSRAAEARQSEPRAATLLVGELRYLRQRARTHPELYQVASIANVREGQMIRIAQLAGLITDEPESKLAAEIRKRIRLLRLERDADQLVPNALVAQQSGRLEEYMNILKARSEGDGGWLGRMLTLSEGQRIVNS